MFVGCRVSFVANGPLFGVCCLMFVGRCLPFALDSCLLLLAFVVVRCSLRIVRYLSFGVA